MGDVTDFKPREPILYEMSCPHCDCSIWGWEMCEIDGEEYHAHYCLNCGFHTEVEEEWEDE
jgi:predicted RNA-binding Zn-ribbon protein involved in translation (DUF1610 family)